MTTDEKLDLLLEEMQGMKKEIHGMKKEIHGMENEMQGMKKEMQGMKSDIKNLEYNQLTMQATIDNTINRCIQVLSDAHSLNAERLDKFNIESVRQNVEIALTLAKIASDKVDRFIERQAKHSA